MNDIHDLKVLIESRIPFITLETHEEARANELIDKLARLNEWTLFSWSVTGGLRRRTGKDEVFPETSEPEAVLRHIAKTLHNGIYVLFDFHPYLSEPVPVRLLKEIAQGYYKTARTIIFISHRIELPPEIARHGARFQLRLPDVATIRDMIREEAELWQRQNGQKVKADRDAHDMLVQHLVGLTFDDVQRLVRQAIRNDGAISFDDVKRIVQAKQQMVGGGQLLQYEMPGIRETDIGGLANLKRWLKVRQPAMLGQVPAIDPPRGVLLLGVQGGGKSLAAKAIAGSWQLPLLRLDFGSLYNKFYGETERNLREALQAADALAPCVLWIDEIEKAIAHQSTEDGLSKRMLGNILTWMSERRSRVFLVATANDIKALPPELLRKGRFDEIFFVDLPDAATRGDIFGIHLRRREQDPKQFDLDGLSQASEGFSGSEIEQAIVSAHYQAAATQSPLTTELVLNEIRQTRPLSTVMAESVSALREWARDRAVPAN